MNKPLCARFTFLLAHILRPCTYMDFLIDLMSFLSRILRVPSRLYHEQKTRWETAHLPILVPADSNSAEYHAMCYEIAVEVYQGRLVVPRWQELKQYTRHRHLGTMPLGNHPHIDKQMSYRLYPVAALLRLSLQSDLSEQDSQKSFEIIREIDFLCSKLQMHGKLQNGALYDNGAIPAQTGILKVEEPRCQEYQVEYPPTYPIFYRELSNESTKNERNPYFETYTTAL